MTRSVLDALLAGDTPEDFDPDHPERVRYLCPLHGGHAVSYTVSDDGAELVFCHAGCDQSDLWSALAPPSPPCTVETLADYLGVPESWLEEAGCQDAPWWKPNGDRIDRVSFVYPSDPVTGEPRVRYRTSLNGSSKFAWAKGVKVKNAGLLYRGEDLPIARDSGVILVEGESDVEVVRRGAGLIAVGLPGGKMWHEPTHAPQFADVSTIFAVIEPDDGGAAMFSSLARSSVRDKVRAVRLPGAKDARDFYLLDPASFRARLDQALSESLTIDQVEAEIAALEAVAQLTAAGALPQQPDILAIYLAEVRRRGYVGEEQGLVAVFLAIASALLRRPISVKLEGVSSVGKSALLEAALDFFPDSYYFFRSTMTRATLLYTPESFAHRTILFAEAGALRDDDFVYTLRTLVSERKLVHEVTVKDLDTGDLTTKTITKPGPTGLVTSTTSVRLDPEIETRMLAIPTDDSSEQTARVMEAEAVADEEVRPENDDALLDQFKAYLSWVRLQGTPAQVSIPYRRKLARMIPPKATRLRRDFRTLCSCIEAHALLHRATRQVDEKGRVIATLDDYAIVRRYLGDAFSENVAATISSETVDTVNAVAEIVAEKTANDAHSPDGIVDRTASYKELGAVLELDPSAARRRAIKCLDAGYLANAETRPHKPAKLATGQPLPVDEQHLLPTVEELAARIGASDAA